jgi:mono/diheme cytochrome c family protein
MRKYGKKALVAAVAAAVAVTAGAAAPKRTPELVAKGKASYGSNCAACHGDAGLGDGVAAVALDPKPRNLVKDRYRRGASAAQVFETITKGMDGTTMASFAHLAEDERWALAYYVLDLHETKAR